MMRRRSVAILVAAAILAFSGRSVAQEMESEPAANAPQHKPYSAMTPQQRAAATRAFLGLGPPPDKAAAALGAPLFQRDCAFCHGPLGRGATAPSLITSDVVLDDNHGEHLLPFLKKGIPAKGMPAFPTISDDQLTDIAEFLHLQVEDVANRGAYHVLNILVGNADQGHAYVAAHCVSCHNIASFSHFADRFRSPDQLQREWVWPSRSKDPALAITARVTLPKGGAIAGRVTQLSDFRITLVDSKGVTHAIDRTRGAHIEIEDPLAAHQSMIMTLTNSAMHDVTAYLETLR
ncbi:MAG TPA: c-type cytochrome [Terracidiphilus sp.]|nr:c-type cytochrome [Terracidiphilus sp.]